MTETEDLGLFPLDTVLVPGERLPLHLFEPRYRQLYADCVLDDRPFVLIRADATGSSATGCIARFAALIRRHEDGRLDVVVEGEAVGRVVEETDGRLYFSARIERLTDPPVSVDGAVAGTVRTLAAELLGAESPEGTESVPLSYAVAAAVPLAPDAKQELLDERDENARLSRLAGLLRQAAREVSHRRHAAESAATNGRVSTPS